MEAEWLANLVTGCVSMLITVHQVRSYPPIPASSNACSLAWQSVVLTAVSIAPILPWTNRMRCNLVGCDTHGGHTHCSLIE